jgi:hypothetical protein
MIGAVLTKTGIHVEMDTGKGASAIRRMPE